MPTDIYPFGGRFTTGPMGSFVFAPGGHPCAQLVDGRVIPRGWGHAQHMPDAESLWRMWCRFVEKHTAEATTAAEAAAMMNAAMGGAP